jgi:hypothetical protein
VENGGGPSPTTTGLLKPHASLGCSEKSTSPRGLSWQQKVKDNEVLVKIKGEIVSFAHSYGPLSRENPGN